MTLAVNRSFPAFILTVAALAAGSGAVAGPPKPASLDPVVTVHFEGLDTSSMAGSRILYTRLSAAALAVCQSGADWYPSEHWAQRQCYRATLDRAVAKLNIPALTALHLKEMNPATVTAALQPGGSPASVRPPR